MCNKNVCRMWSDAPRPALSNIGSPPYHRRMSLHISFSRWWRWLALALTLVVIAAILTPTRPAPAAVSSSVVFQQNTNGYACFRIPAVVQTSKGTLLAFAEGRKNDCGDTGNIDIVLRRSTDGGASWKDLQVVAAGNGSTRHNPVPVVDTSNDRVVLLSSRNYSTAWVQQITGDGTSWGSPKEITASVKLSGWQTFATGPSHGIQLARGAYPGRLVAGATYSASGGQKGGALIYSDDGGATWSLGARSHAADPALKVQELSVFERPDGSLYAVARNEKGTSSAQTAYAISTDSGESFTGPFSAIQGLVVPTVQASTLAIRATDQGSSYDRVLLAAPSHPSERRTMTIRSSFDGGQTWQTAAQGKVVYAELAAYSDLVALSENQFGVLYEGGTDYTYASIRFTRFTESDVDLPNDPASITGNQNSATLLTSNPSQRHVFAVSSTAGLGHWFQEPTGEVKRSSWASNVAGEAVAMLYAGHQHVFVRGADGALLRRWWDPAASSLKGQTWAPAGSVAGSPTGFATSGAPHVFARAADGSLRHWWWDGQVKSQTWAPAGALAGDPVALLYGGQQHVWAAGADGRLLHWWWQSGAPVRQESWGGSAKGGATAFVNKGTVHVFASNSSDQVAHWFWSPSTQQVARQVWSAGAALKGRPVAFAWNGQQHVFARDVNDNLGHWWWASGYTAPAHSVWAQGLYSDPMALVTGEQQHLFGAAADGTLTHWWWDSAGGLQTQSWGGDIALDATRVGAPGPGQGAAATFEKAD